MGVQVLSIILVIIALLMLYLSFKTLLKSGWFIKWLKGTVGFLSFGATLLALIVAYNLVLYKSVEEGQVIATLRFVEVAPQEFDVELVRKDELKSLYRIQGDQWQLDVRLIKVSAWFDGDLPAYKLDRLSGRYLSLEQENSDKRTAHNLAEIPVMDTWPWIANKDLLGIVQANYGSATFMPMANGAIYQVRLFHDGLDAVAVNDQAKQALSNW
ncbi:MAG: cation/multidrug efflux pump [Gammaproteobacteria bacterium]|nr:cation/multidrug efflux pump [Gammaproteobacteria bacterium]